MRLFYSVYTEVTGRLRREKLPKNHHQTDQPEVLIRVKGLSNLLFKKVEGTARKRAYGPYG